MNAALPIGLAAGAVSALLFVAPVSGSWLGLTLILFYLAPLPNFIAGLGYGQMAATVAGVGGVLASGLAVGPLTGLTYALALGAPAALLSSRALLSRPAESPPGGLEWYSVGRLIAWATLIAASLAALVAIAVGWDGASWPKMVEETLRNGALSEIVKSRGLTDDEIRRASMMIAHGMPAACAIIWLAAMSFNLWAADRVVEMSGRAQRPRLRFSDVELPSSFPVILAVALGLSFAPGIVGMIGTGFVGALLFAYLIVGLGIVHIWARNRAHGALVLAAVYGTLILFGWVAIVLAVIGLAEPLLRLRERAVRSASNSSQPDE